MQGVVFLQKSNILEAVAEELFYQEDDSGLFILARGHITAAVSTDLRELILERLTRAPVPAMLAVDLSQCEYMDSTFMGLLVGFHKRYRALTDRPLIIARPTQECIKLLNGLGILKLMQLENGNFPVVPTAWKGIRAQHDPSPEVLLNAHKNLSELSAENQKKFSSLQSVLETQLKAKED